MSNYEFLQDKRFLHQLDSLRIKQQFIKITVLNWKEQPLQEIQGIAISGTVNLDGNSSMRRTATLSIFAQEKENNLANVDNLFSVNKKCTLELGIVNTVPEYIFQTINDNNMITVNTINYQQRYGNIVWFPLGLYVMFNPAIAHSMTGVTISMNLKDKMCLLNGDLGGQIHSAVEFSAQDEKVDADSLTLEKNPVLIYNIIKQLINHWGNEPLSNILISEVPLKIKTVAKWIGQENIYLVRREEEYQGETTTNWYLETEPKENDIIEETIEPGRDAGFLYDPFIYPGELSCNAGQTVTSVLDKIIQVMGNYEYFYDVFGHFIFREKQNYLNMTNTAYWTKKTKEEDEENKIGQIPQDQYKIDIRLTKPVYSFIQNEFTNAYNNTLNYNNIKNDFVVWGAYTAGDGKTKYPCRFHLSIDRKPECQQHDIALYRDSFQIVRAVAWNKELNKPSAEKGYQDELFPEATTEEAKGKVFATLTRTAIDWREEIYYQMCESEKIGTDADTQLNNSYFQYYAELKEEFPKIFNLETQEWINDIKNYPESISYYLDFIDDTSQLGQYSVNNIGRRAKIIDENDNINCVFEPMVPDIVYIDTSKYATINQVAAEEERLTDMGQRWTQIDSNIYDLFSIGGVLNSCYQKIKDLLYQFTHINNTISITSLPIYYLEPNSRISIEDGPSGIYGDYIVQSISLPLDISSMMTVNAYKALQKI